MNRFLWDKYAPGEVNEKIRYWVDLWEALIDDLTDPYFGLVFMNPHLLVRHIIDEIVFNNFRNADNRAYFQKQLDLFVKEDPATKKMFSSDMALIRREFGKRRLSYLHQLCRSVDLAYSHSSYLDDLYTSLLATIRSPAWQPGDEAAIRLICQCMIVELTLKGYSLDTIKTLPSSIFDKTTEYFDSGLHPSSVKESNLRDGIHGLFDYRAALQAEVDALAVESRLESFRHYFHPKGKQAYFIFQIEGLKGDKLDITIADVNLYSPKSKRYIKAVPGSPPDSRWHDELFGTTEDTCFANAAVHMDEFDMFASEKEAVALIEKALDLFRTFVPSDVPFKVMSNRFIRVSPEGEYWGGCERGGPMGDLRSRLFLSVDLAQLLDTASSGEFLRVAGEHLFRSRHSDSAGLQIAHSLHWYRKAEEAQVSEDRLLGYWIVLENIVNMEKSDTNVLLPEKERETKYPLIRAIVPAIETCLFLANAAKNLYYYLNRVGVALPLGSVSDPAAFVDQLPMIADGADRKMIKDAVISVHKLYTDAPSATQDIADRVNAVKEDLLMLYLLRNRIVHNAHYDNNLLPLFVEKLRRYAGNVLRQVLNDVFIGREQSIERSLLRYHVSLTRIQETLKKGKAVDFLHWEF